MRDIKELNKRLLSLSLVLLMLMAMVGNDVYVAATAEEVVAEASAEGGGEESGTVDNSAPAQESAPAAEPASSSADAGAPNNIEGTGGSDQSVDQPATTDVDGQSVDQPATAEEGQPTNTEGQSTDQTTTNAEDQSTVEEGQPTDPASEITENPTNTETIPESEKPSDIEETEDTHTVGETYYEIITNEDGTQTKVVYEYVTDEETGKLIAVEKERVDGTFDENGDPVVAEEEAEEETHEEGETYFEIIENEDGTQTKIIYEYVLDEETGKLIAVEKERITGTFDADGNLIEEECEHEYEYVSNGDGTHVKRCIHCGEEITEECTLDEDGVCTHCGYEDERLVYQEFTRTFYGTKVVVSGMMPRGATVDILYVGTKAMEEVVNNNLEEGAFVATAAYNINIYRRSGEKYQPQDDGNTVKVSFLGLEELEDKDEEEVTVYRIEEDYTITEIESEIVGEDVYFDAEHFTTYVTGTYNSSNWVTLSPIQKFATIQTAVADKYTRVLKAKFDVKMEANVSYTFTASVYKSLTSTSTTDPTKGTLVSQKTIIIDASTSSQTTAVEIPFDVDDTGYISGGETYSIVVSTTNDEVEIGYGTQHGTYNAPTYMIGVTGAWESSSYDEIFYIVSDDTVEITDKTTDSYVIDSISATTAEADSSGYYHLGKGDTETFTAKILDGNGNEVDRTVTWSIVENTSTVATIVSATGELTAVGPGSVTVRASYVNATTTSTKDVTVYVLSFTINGWDPDSTDAQPTISYTGKEVQPTVKAYSASGTEASVTITKWDNNINVSTSTSKASVTISQKVNTKTYTYTRSFTISPITLTVDAFASADLTASGSTISSITGVSKISDVTPVFNTDFVVNSFTSSAGSTGITYVVNLSGTGNFTGDVTWTKLKTGLDISDLYSVSLTSKGNNFKDEEYTALEKTLTVDSSNNNSWLEVAFTDSDGQVVTDVINKDTADYIITDKGGTDESAITAGEKTITFTMKDNQGYTGSLSVNFTIQKASMSSTTIKWKHNNVDGNYQFDHTGEKIEPVAGTDFDVYIGNEVLTADTDYTTSYIGDRTETTDSPEVRVTGAGNNFDSSTYKQSAYKIIPCYKNDLVIRITDGSNYDGTSSNGYATGYTTYYNPNMTSKYFATTDSKYDSTDATPTIKVFVPNATIVEGEDYKIGIYNDAECTETLTNDVTSGTTKYIKVTGLNTYAGIDKVATYTVERLPLSNVTVTISSSISKTFDGTEQKLTTGTSTSSSSADITLKYGATVLSEGTDYEITYSDNTNAGTATYTITGLGNYKGTLSGDKYQFTINQASIASGNSDNVVVGLVENKTYKYTGKVITPAVKVSITDGTNTTYSETIDPSASDTLYNDNFSVTYEQNPAPGERTITISATSNGNLKDDVVVKFTITSNTSGYSINVTGENGVNAAIVKSTPTSADSSGNYEYEYYLDDTFITHYKGSGIKQSCAVTVYDSEGNELTRNKDYTLSYVNSTEANISGDWSKDSSPYIYIKGYGSYAHNNAVVYFKIQPVDISNVTVVEADNTSLDDEYQKNYDSGNDVKLSLTLTYVNGSTSTTLTEGTDYTLDYSSNESIGTAGKKIVKIAGTDNFTGEISKTYYVGKDISSALVTISPYNGRDYLIDTESTYFKANATNTTTDTSRWSIPWRGNASGIGQAPIIGFTMDSTGLSENTDYEVKSIETTLTGDNAYDARLKTDDAKSSTNYNKVNYTITGKGGYYGKATVYYQIIPVSISDSATNSRIRTAGNKTMYYTGDSLYATPELYYYPATVTLPSASTDGAYNLTSSDFTPENALVGTDAVSSKSNTFAGVGNFTDSITIVREIVPGYVKVYYEDASDSNNLLIDTSSSTYTAAITQETFIFDGTAKEPKLVVTDMSGNDITSSKCTISYTSNTNPGTATINIKITGDNYEDNSKNLTVTFTIATNSIESFTATFSDDYEYIASVIDPTQIKSDVESSAKTLKLATGTSSSSTTLTYGTDYEIVTDKTATDSIAGTTVLAAIQAQENDTSITEIYGANKAPSYGDNTNWFWLHGIGSYSGYKKVTFNIILNLNSSYANVTMNAKYTKTTTSATYGCYDLDESGAPTTAYTPIIKYMENQGESTYSQTLANPLNHTTVTRAREGLPGPDADITVTAKENSACSGTVTGVTYTNGNPVCFLVDVKTYKSLTLAGGTVYDYTGSNITVDFSELKSAGAIQATTTTDGAAGAGDYIITYSGSGSVPKDVGLWYAVLKPGTGSRYFIENSNTSGTNYPFYIKYNLSNATMEFIDGSSQSVTELPYTGSAITVPAQITVTDSSQTSGKTIIYNSSITDYVTISPTTVTLMGDYTIRAEAKDETKVYGSLSASLKVAGISLENATVTLSGTEFDYTGSEIKPTVTVTVPGRSDSLRENTDYTVSYTNNVNAGTATVTVEGINAYSGKKTAEFTINQVAITASMITVGEAIYAGYGVEVKPTITVKNGTHTLTEGVDYTTPVYTNNASGVSTKGSVTISAVDNGNYTGTNISKEFTISQLDLRSSTITIDPTTTEYTGKTIDPYDIITVKVNDTVLKSKKTDSTGYDYTINVLNAAGSTSTLQELGQYTIQIVGANNCTQTNSVIFEVTARSLSNNFHYYYSKTDLKFIPGNWEDYYVTADTRYVISTDTEGLRIYLSDVTEVNGTDNPTNIPTLVIEDLKIAGTSTTYKVLEEGTDYEISLTNNSAAGTGAWNRDGSDTVNATVADGSPAITITGKGNYTDSITLPYNIGKNLNTLTDLKVTYSMQNADQSSYTYTSSANKTAMCHYTYKGIAQKPTPTVYSGTTRLTVNKDYEVSYTDASGEEDASVDAGEKYIVITGLGSYCGTISQLYAINRKEITDASKTFTNETAFTTETAGQLTFTIADTSVKRMDESAVTTYLVDTKLITSDYASQYVNYYYAVYKNKNNLIKPTITVTDNTLGTSGQTKGKLTEDEDYTVAYDDESDEDIPVSTFNKDTGAIISASYITVSIAASTATNYSGGNYFASGSTAATFRIMYLVLQDDISDSDFSVKFMNNGDNGNNYFYNKGYSIEPEIEVNDGTLALTEDVDYTVTLTDNITPGKKTLVVTGIGNYTGEKELEYYIWGNLSETEAYYEYNGTYVKGVQPQLYTGKQIDPDCVLVLEHQNEQTEDFILTNGTEYSASKITSTNDFFSDGTVLYVGNGDYYWQGEKSVNYGIAFNEDDVEITNIDPKYEFTGYPIKIVPELNVSSAEISSIEYYRDDDRTTQTENFTDLGTITVVVNYKVGSATVSNPKEASYEIVSRDISNCNVVYSKNNRYTGYQVKPPLSVFIMSDDNEPYKLTENTDYTVEYGTNIYSPCTVTLTGTGNISGKNTYYPNIVVGTPINLQLTSDSTSVTATWVHDIYADGDEIEIIKVDTGAVVASTTISDGSEEYTFTGLDSVCSYQVKIRSYATINNDLQYSEYKTAQKTTGITTSTIKVTSNSTGKATIDWSEAVGDVTIYKIYRIDEAGNEKKVACYPASLKKYTNSNLTSGSVYYYYVIGYSVIDNTLTEVTRSETMSVTIK